MARPTSLDIFLKQPDPGFCLQCPRLSLASVANAHPVCCHVSAKRWPGDMPHRKSLRDEKEIAAQIHAHTRELNSKFQRVDRPKGSQKGIKKASKGCRNRAFSCPNANECVSYLSEKAAETRIFIPAK